MKCIICGKKTEDSRLLCGKHYSEGKVPDTVKVPKGGK